MSLRLKGAIGFNEQIFGANGQILGQDQSDQGGGPPVVLEGLPMKTKLLAKRVSVLSNRLCGRDATN